MKIVTNTSPLILLAKIGRLDLLPSLYEHVIIPGSVLEEIEAKADSTARQVRQLTGRRSIVIRMAEEDRLQAVPAELGRGEREAIALAVDEKVDLVLLDDAEGRQTARTLGLTVTGTIGLLVEARANSIIDSVQHELDRLVEAGMWIDERFYHRILQEFGE